MAYVFGFPSDVTNAIMDMRDWRWEMVRDGGKTPSASCFNVRGGMELDRQKPILWAVALPCYQVQSDSEEPNFGDSCGKERQTEKFRSGALILDHFKITSSGYETTTDQCLSSFNVYENRTTTAARSYGFNADRVSQYRTFNSGVLQDSPLTVRDSVGRPRSTDEYICLVER